TKLNFSLWRSPMAVGGCFFMFYLSISFRIIAQPQQKSMFLKTSTTALQHYRIKELQHYRI
ncbi:hypothetical protein, partial [Levilactobacillus brevis]|uniref:hypothetical protein n=1 Tax=Levilactobacillus brevis TaxID=1580 RepID=UPI001CDB7BA7